MKNLLCILLPLLVAFTTTDWITVKIDDRAIVDFPSQPSVKNENGTLVWGKDVDSVYKVIVSRVDLENLGMDSSGVADELQKQSALDDFAREMVSAMPGSALVSKVESKVFGKTAYHFEIDLPKKEGQYDKLFSMLVFAGDTMYRLSFYGFQANPLPELRKKFQGSFKLIN